MTNLRCTTDHHAVSPLNIRPVESGIIPDHFSTSWKTYPAHQDLSKRARPTPAVVRRKGKRKTNIRSPRSMPAHCRAGKSGGWSALCCERSFNHTSLVGIVISTDRPKSVRNHYVIEVFDGVCELSLCFLDFSVGVGAFVLELSLICSFFHDNISSFLDLSFSKKKTAFAAGLDYLNLKQYISLLLWHFIRVLKYLLSTFLLYTPHCHMIWSKQKCCLWSTGVSTESQNLTSVLHLRQDFLATRNMTRIDVGLARSYVKLLLSSWKTYMCNLMAWYINK